jgi:hypothetical protein
MSPTHDQHSHTIDIPASAPVIARKSIVVAASPEATWAVLSDIPRWPEWNAAVARTCLEGPLARGTTFRWKAGPGMITSTIEAVEPPRLLAWTGKTMGIKAVHVHRLTPVAEGTHVTSEESWDGLVVRLLPGSMHKTLRASIEAALESLKAEVEHGLEARRLSES